MDFDFVTILHFIDAVGEISAEPQDPLSVWTMNRPCSPDVFE